MNKNDMIDTLVEEHDVTKTFAREAMDTVFGSIIKAAKKGKKSRFSELANSGLRSAVRANCVIPKTGDPIKIGAPAFRSITSRCYLC
jgi:DNA-binding protein HU-beta